MAILNSSNIVNNNVIQTNDLTQLYDALNYNGSLTQYLVEISGSLLGTASYATTASFALNGGGGGGAVTQIIAGPNITLSPVGGTGNVTVTATTPPGTFPYVGDAIITGSLTITGSNLGPDLIIIGSVNATEGFTGSLFGTANTASYVTTAQTASYVLTAQTASYVLTAQTASLAITSQTASKVNVIGVSTSNASFPLIFVGQNAAGAQQLRIDTDANAAKYNPLLNSISSFRFTGSLLGTSSQATSASYANTSSLAYTINTLNNTSNNLHFLTFVDTNNPTSNSETLFTATNLKVNPLNNLLSATTLSSSAVTASSITSSFTGSLFGTATTASYVLTAQTASFATKADTINTVGTTTNTNHFLTFVDTNNITSTGESVYTDPNLTYNPSTNLLSVTSINAISFTGSLLGTSSQATSASYAHTASVPLTTTQWYSYNSAQAIPAGRDVGIVHTYTGASPVTYRLNTSSCQIGDQVRLATAGTFTNGGIVSFTTNNTVNPTTSGSIIVAGYTNNPSSYNTVQPVNANISGSQASWKWICVKATNRPTWQLVNYVDYKVGQIGLWDLGVS